MRWPLAAGRVVPRAYCRGRTARALTPPPHRRSYRHRFL